MSVRPWSLKSVPDPMPNSSMLVLPTKGDPACRRRPVGVESYGGVKPARAAEDAVVWTPRVQKLSLAAYGMPSRGPARHPRAPAEEKGTAGGGGGGSEVQSETKILRALELWKGCVAPVLSTVRTLFLERVCSVLLL